MSVDVDYGAGHVIYDVLASEAFTQETSELVQDRGEDVYGYLLELGDSADISAAEAITRIDLLKGFQASVRSVNFNAPDAPLVELVTVPEIDPPDVDSPNLSRSSLDNGFEYVLEEAREGEWDAPPDVEYTTPPVPGLDPGLPLPSAPGAYNFPATAVPDLATPDFTPDVIPVPALEAVDVALADLVVIEDFEIDVDTSALLSAIEAMKAFDPVPPVLPEYMYLIPEIFSVTGSMAAGDTIVNYTQLLANRDALLSSTQPSAANAFDRRGLSVPDGAPVYDQWLDDILKSKLGDSDTIFEAVAIDEVVRTAFQLGTAAHRMLVDIETGLYKLEFDVAKALVNTQVEKAKSLGAIYKAEVLLLQNAIAEYNATAAQVTARAKVFEANAGQVQVVGQLNKLTADLFVTEESVKGVDADVYKALVSAERAKLGKYKAVIDSYKKFVAEAQSAVADHSGKTALYGAEVTRISTQYDTYSTQAQSVQFENSARATTLGAKGSELKALASVSDSSAAAASAKAIDLSARASVRETAFIKRAIHSDEEAASFRITGTDYDQQLAAYTIDLSQRGAELAGKSDLAQMVSRYVRVAQEAIGRAATLSQTANTQLARAYATVYDAAGRAGAAVASGKLSGFRASANMSAGESLSASNSYAVGYAGSGVNSFSETDSETEG